MTTKGLNKLTATEKMYFNIMNSKSGVLYITAKPGVGKSAITKGIADKLGYKYIDLRLSMVDETDIGLYPDLAVVDGKKYLNHVTPLWAKEANEQPTIIHFEELNRASLAVRNAALQMLLERTIGTEFAFNDNVLMVASGNLGEKDGTDVEEFDAALKNRLVHVPHNVTPQEWIENFAKDNVVSTITSYISGHPEELYPTPSENSNAFASNRSWTFFSDYIKSTYGEDAGATEVLKAAGEVGSFYIGASIVKFMRYIESTIHINIKDVITNFPKIKDELRKSNKSKYSELLHELREVDLDKLKVKEIKNVVSFLKLTRPDERAGYLLNLSNNMGTDESEFKRTFSLLREFKSELVELSKLGETH